VSTLWGGRFEGGPAPEAAALGRSTHFDARLVTQDCRILAAHAHALAGAGVLSKAEADEIGAALHGIAEDIVSGAFPVAEGDEDIHTTVERALDDRLPALAGKVRAGLSRNDRVATALRLWLADAAAHVRRLVADLVAALADRAAEHEGAIMPGYTHLQRAQPVTLGAVLAAHAEALRRDAERIQAAETRCRTSPLGAGALAGSTLGLDRAAEARELGLDDVMANPIDAVAARDFVAEFLAAAAIAGVHLSRIGEEIVLWTSSEFGYAELDDASATGSSLMPQKKNPDVAELARGKAGRLIGDLAGFLSAAKGLPLAYNRDLQEDKEPAFDAADTLTLALPAIALAVRTMRFDTARMREAASDPLLLATDVAEHLVRGGVPFRDAHEAVGGAVRAALDEGKPWTEWSVEDWRRHHAAFGEDIVKALDPAASVAVRFAGIGEQIRALGAWAEAALKA
jgi:argininosuccinate lyase